MERPFHLAWFVSRGYGPKAWRYEWGGDQSRWMMPDLFVDLAVAMERAGFDYVMMEDSSNVPYTHKGTHDDYLKYAMAAPKLDPAVLVPYMAMATKRIGLVTTMSTTEYPPFLLARLVNTLDHVTEGRVGWNMVTGSNEGRITAWIGSSSMMSATTARMSSWRSSRGSGKAGRRMRW